MVGRTGTPLEERRTAVGAVDVSDPSPRERTSADADAASRVTVIRPASRLPRLDVAELWHYRELLWTLVWRDVAVRYKQTFLGVAWAILVPAFTALVYVIVFGKFANFPAGSTPYPSLVVAGVLPMQYFASSLSLASLSLLSNLPARHEGLLPADAPPARRRVRAARRLRRRAARARLPHLEVRHVAVRAGRR